MGRIIGGLTEGLTEDLSNEVAGGAIGDSNGAAEPPPDIIAMVETLNFSLKWLLWIPFILGMLASFYFTVLVFKESKKS